MYKAVNVAFSTKFVLVIPVEYLYGDSGPSINVFMFSVNAV